MFKQLNEDSTYSAHEPSQLKYWTDIDLLNKIEETKSDDVYRFMDGPPFVSGKLHVGHFAIGSIKSMVLNYQRQKGKRCLNKLGYDCHGLPVENRICKEKGLKTIADIEEVGIDQFCEWCKEMINRYSNPSNPESWPPSMWRIGRWADYFDTYKTMDVEFMESVWHVFKTMFNKDLVYMGYKVVPYSWACQTSLSNFEASQNYKEKNTKSAYVLFPVNGAENTYFVAWTTTVWTLPSNMALCVGPDIDYFKIEFEGKFYYVSKNRAPKLFKKSKYTVIEEMKGSDLGGMEYSPVFDYFADRDGLFRVLVDKYVKDDPLIGTGIIHQSPPFGEDDFNICVRNGMVSNTSVGTFCTVDDFGKFNELVPDFKGCHVCDDQTTINLIIKMKEKGLFLKTEMYTHNYPYCYRTDTPLIYRVVNSVFIKVTALKDQMLALNKRITWHPKTIGENRFKNWLENARDWAVSRTRYFGTPIPLWVSDDGDIICIGSREELAKYTGKDVSSYTDIHKELMDKEFIEYEGKRYTRITEIFDCWFESGCVPYGQVHYPFENKDLIDSVDYLSDFIVEGLDQTRGWFYTLLVVATAMSDGTKVPFKNVMCTGMILDEHGDKISKRLGNYIDINEYLTKYGADILRVYMVGSPLINADPLLFNPRQVDVLKKNQIRYINGVKFFLEHANNYQINGNEFKVLGIDMDFSEVTDLFDRWILSRLSDLSASINEDMTHYRLNKVVDNEQDFIEDIVNWYIKFNRSRMKGLCGADEWDKSLSVLHFVLHTYARLCSPITPFLSDYVHQHVYMPVVADSPESIHFMSYPEFPSMRDETLDSVFCYLKTICEGVRTLRDKSDTHSSVRMPLKKCVVYHDDAELLGMIAKNMNMVQEEVNCLDFEYSKLKDNIVFTLEPNFKAIGQTFRKLTGRVVSTLRSLSSDSIAEMGEHISIVLDSVTHEIPKDCYAIVKKPLEKDDGMTTLIVRDIMISADFTFDETVRVDYITKCIHSNIQNARKDMNLHPWDKVSVKLSPGLQDLIGDLPERLSKSLTNSVVTWNGSNDTLDRTLDIRLGDSVLGGTYGVQKV